MPAGIDAPEVVAADHHDRDAAWPQAHTTPPGCWHTRAPSIGRPQTQRSHGTLRSWALTRPQTLETSGQGWHSSTRIAPSRRLLATTLS
jgi:hypothetical protein